MLQTYLISAGTVKHWMISGTLYGCITCMDQGSNYNIGSYARVKLASSPTNLSSAVP